jgi:hypothetical protein
MAEPVQTKFSDIDPLCAERSVAIWDGVVGVKYER